MSETILMYDVLNENSETINSQVIINNMGFEIPNDYYFIENLTRLNDKILYLTDGKNVIQMYYEKCNNQNYENKVKEIKESNLILETFDNYRGQKIIEYECEKKINIMGYDGDYIIVINSDCKRYSRDYYTLYYILFSCDSRCEENYDNLYYQKNNLSILVNGKHVYDRYQKNIIKYVPEKILLSLINKSYCNYLESNKEFDENLSNYYIKNDIGMKKVIKKIESYFDSNNDDISMRDLIEE